jgi:maltose alpha-D-glucosyltransferase / alpha-amylase
MATLERIRDALHDHARAQADTLLGCRDILEARIRAAARIAPGSLKTRLHGDLHLGQVLVVERDFYVIDFEGEPSRGLPERRRKSSALRDVAGMARSFDYAAWAAAFRLKEKMPAAAEVGLSDALAWRDAALAHFLDGYRRELGDCGIWPARDEDGWRLLDLFVLEKACYEICYEAANRPQWITIPLAGIVALLEDQPDESEG